MLEEKVMSRRKLLIVVLCGLLTLAGCNLVLQSTGHTSTDPQAAQRFFPQFGNYNISATDDIQTAITTALGGAGLLTGNPAQAALVAQIDTVINCYKEVGAVDARIYIERVTLDDLRIPTAGVLAVINQDRIRENFLSCVTRTPLGGLLGAQSAQPEPCLGSGTFTFEGNTISFLYAATDTPLCDLFAQHFRQYGG
jgi:hypothetical protein